MSIAVISSVCLLNTCLFQNSTAESISSRDLKRSGTVYPPLMEYRHDNLQHSYRQQFSSHSVEQDLTHIGCTPLVRALKADDALSKRHTCKIEQNHLPGDSATLVSSRKLLCSTKKEVQSPHCTTTPKQDTPVAPSTPSLPHTALTDKTTRQTIMKNSDLSNDSRECDRVEQLSPEAGKDGEEEVRRKRQEAQKLRKEEWQRKHQKRLTNEKEDEKENKSSGDTGSGESLVDCNDPLLTDGKCK